jgi:hypothetical protein
MCGVIFGQQEARELCPLGPLLPGRSKKIGGFELFKGRIASGRISAWQEKARPAFCQPGSVVGDAPRTWSGPGKGATAEPPAKFGDLGKTEPAVGQNAKLSSVRNQSPEKRVSTCDWLPAVTSMCIDPRPRTKAGTVLFDTRALTLVE